MTLTLICVLIHLILHSLKYLPEPGLNTNGNQLATDYIIIEIQFWLLDFLFQLATLTSKQYEND